MQAAPYGALCGETSVGKTSLLLQSLPDYLWLTTSPSTLSGARAWCQKQGLNVPWAGEADYNLTNPQGPICNAAGEVIGMRPIYNWHARFLTLIFHLQEMALGFRAQNNGIPGLPRRALIPWESNELEFCNNFKGIIISDANHLFKWIYDGCEFTEKTLAAQQQRKPNMFNVIGQVKSVLELLKSFNACTGLGVVLDMHWGPVVDHTDKEGKSTGVQKYPAGPAFPIGTMRAECVRSLQFCWKVTKPNDTTRKVTVSGNPEKQLVKTRHVRMPEDEKLRKPTIVISEDFTIRDLLLAFGFDALKDQTIFHENFRAQHPDRFPAP